MYLGIGTINKSTTHTHTRSVVSQNGSTENPRYALQRKIKKQDCNQRNSQEFVKRGQTV